jgi:hypothetical protein
MPPSRHTVPGATGCGGSIPAGEQTLNEVSLTHVIPSVQIGFDADGGNHPGYLKAPLLSVSAAMLS